MFKKSDYIIISVICFFLGIFVISQVLATKKYTKLIQPENNAVLALEVSKQTKVNSDLRREVQDLTILLDGYKNSTESNQRANDLYVKDVDKYSVLNGEKSKRGQGIVISIDGNLNTPQVVDLINAIKNIGADLISINNTRILLNTNLSQFSDLSHYEIGVIGNSSLLKSAIERKGGIMEQISNKDINFNITEHSDLEIPASDKQIKFKYSKIIE